MQFISVKQPWAHLLVNGLKNVENRDNPLPKKLENQWIGIHAMSSKDDLEDHIQNVYDSCFFQFETTSVLTMKCVMQYEKGQMIGAVQFVNNKPNNIKATPFKDVPHETRYHWYVKDCVALAPPFKQIGAQGFAILKNMDNEIKLKQAISDHLKV